MQPVFRPAHGIHPGRLVLEICVPEVARQQVIERILPGIPGNIPDIPHSPQRRRQPDLMLLADLHKKGRKRPEKLTL